MHGLLPRLIAPACLALALLTAPVAAMASCAAPTPATACPQCALAVVGTFNISDTAGPSVTVEQVIRRRGNTLPDLAARLRVVMPESTTDASGARHYMECAFVPADGQRMLYLMDPAPGAPGQFRIVWGFTPDASSAAPIAEHHLP